MSALYVLLGLILTFGVIELIVRFLLALKFKTLGQKNVIDALRYPIGLFDWRVFSEFGDFKDSEIRNLFRFSTQADEMGISLIEFQSIMAKANRSSIEEVRVAYTGKPGFEAMSYRPFVGMTTKPNQKLSYAHIDSFGFQSPHDFKRKEPNIKRALILGGSVAYGIGALSPDKSLRSQVEFFLNEKEKKAGSAIRWEVINLAFVASQSTSELNQAAIYTGLFTPDIIVQLSGYNDLNFFLLESQKLYTYHGQGRVKEYLESTLSDKIWDRLTQCFFTIKILRKIFSLRPQAKEGQLYTVW